jgi:hypothetical protein
MKRSKGVNSIVYRNLLDIRHTMRFNVRGGFITNIVYFYELMPASHVTVVGFSHSRLPQM